MPLSESKARRIQQISSVAIAVACWALLSIAYIAGFFRTFDRPLLDWRFRLRGERTAVDSIAIVAIDDATIRGYKGSWPLPRNMYAVLIEALEGAGARSIGFDVLFPANTALDPKNDALLAYVSSSYPNIIHAFSFHSDPSEPHDDPDAELLETLGRQGSVAGNVPVPRYESISLPYRDLVLDGIALGHVTVPPDDDGAIRRQQLLIRYGDRLYSALALRMAGVAWGFSGPPEVKAEGGRLRVGWQGTEPLSIDADENGATAIDFAGDHASFPNTFSMLRVLQQHKAGDRQWLQEHFSNRTVLIGVDSRQEVTEDVGTTPFAAATSLLFIHANALDNLFRGRFLRQAPTGPYLGVLAILAVFLGWVFSTRSVPASVLVAALAFAVIAGLDFALFAGWAIDAPPVAALALAPLICVTTGAFRYVFLERVSRKLQADLEEGVIVQQEFLPEALVGQTLSHYKVLARLDRGRGGQGIVYLGRDTRGLERDVAIKVLHGRTLADVRSRRRFRREARALSRLSHPHIASIYEFASQNGLEFIAMEFVAGTPLSERIPRGLSERDSLIIAIQIAEALAEAHSKGVTHRDLKPANVVLTAKGSAKVLDFGLAKLDRAPGYSATVSQDLTDPNQIMGTLAYMAPELFQGQPADARSDLYSLGVVLFEMLTKCRPFPEEEPQQLYFAILNHPVPAPTALNPKISTAVEAIVLQTLHKDPSRRPKSVQELLLQLRELLARSNQAAVR